MYVDSTFRQLEAWVKRFQHRLAWCICTSHLHAGNFGTDHTLVALIRFSDSFPYCTVFCVITDREYANLSDTVAAPLNIGPSQL